MSATLGGVIKDLRMQKNLSQIELAFALGWKEPSRISRVEQGRSGNPSREWLDELMDVMNLSSEERNYLLYVGGYVPNEEDIKDVVEKMAPIIDEWKYPASMMDFSWRLIYSNQQTYDSYGISATQQEFIIQTNPNLIEIVFDQNYVLNKCVSDIEMRKREDFLTRMLFHFRYNSRSRTKDGWYIELVGKMMKNDLFRRIWKHSHKMDNLELADMSNFGLKLIPHPLNPKKQLAMHFYFVPVFKNPLFMVELHTPADIDTFEYFTSKQ